MISEKITNNLTALEIRYGKMNIIYDHISICYFIIENTRDKAFFKKQTMDLLLSGIKSFYVYGKYGDIFCNVIREVENLIYSDNEVHKAVIEEFKNLDDFVESINFDISLRPFVPCDYYLIYDDENIYKKVKAKIKA